MASNTQYDTLTDLLNQSNGRSKRKRDTHDVGSEPSYLTTHNDQTMSHGQFNLGSMDHTSNGAMHSNGTASDTAAAALSQYTMNLPSSTEQQFLNSDANQDGSHQMDSFIGGAHGSPTLSSSEFNIDGQPSGGNAGANNMSAGNSKPAVGTAEWHQIRKDNHKEVERRRRETINEGINELAKVVPNCEKNKGAILARSVQYIAQLKDNETGNIEKWTLEKLVAEQVIKDLAKRNERLQRDALRAAAEAAEWRRLAGAAGADVSALMPSVAAKALAAAPELADDDIASGGGVAAARDGGGAATAAGTGGTAGPVGDDGVDLSFEH